MVTGIKYVKLVEYNKPNVVGSKKGMRGQGNIVQVGNVTRVERPECLAMNG